MRKIVYNNKLKKFFASILVVIVLMSSMMPNVVWAEDKIEAKIYKEWLDSAETEKDKELISEQVMIYLRDVVGLYQEYGITTRDQEIYKYMSESENILNIGAIYKPGKSFEVKGYSLIDENGDLIEDKEMSYEELKTWNGSHDKIIKVMVAEYFPGATSLVGGKTPAEVAEKVLELNESTIKFLVSGNNANNYSILSFEIPDKDKETILREACEALGIPYQKPEKELEDTANLGGILLSPVFYLINFIADAITSNLGNIMLEKWADLGIGVLTITKPISSNIVKTDKYYVNVSSFAPNPTLWSLGKWIFTGVGSYQYPNIKYTPEEIFSGQIPLLSIDFISGKSPKLDANGNVVIDPNTKEIIYEENSNSDWLSIRKVISSWYKVLRMIAIIGLLSVLIYTGIKIIISANAKDKAKYKEWIINWFVAVAILFSMHYIMSFIISVTGEINQLLGQSCQGIEVVLYQNIDQATGEKIPIDSFTTNLMGLVRFMIQSENFYLKVGYEVMYIALIVYTVKFTMVYLKRVLNMAFLTLIAPIVALTYPIDKINDGKAQGFEMWLKEYIYNALLQPMHYVMYYILVGSAVSIAAKNPLYGIVVLMFMTEAEKLLKKIFGFDKAGGGTVGGMAGAFAAGAVASSIKNIARMSKLPGGNGGKDGSGGNVEDYLKDPKPAYINDSEDNAVLDEIGDSSNPFANSQETQPDAQPAGTGASAANAFQDSTDPVADSEREALEEKLADGQLAEDDLTDEQKEMLGINSQEDDDSTDSQDNSDNSANPSNPNINDLDSNNSAANNPNSNNSDEGNDKWQSQMNGLKNVGKKLLKPVWDMDIENKEDRRKYNMKRLGKKVGRGVLGASLGIGAAAVQAGISITDGKYNPMEGVATFGAGYAGGGKIAQGVGSLVDTYREGRDEGNKEAIVNRARESWGHREDVIEYNKKKYAKEDREAVLKIQRELLGQGITSTDEMHQCIKYIKSKHDGDVKKFTDKDIKAARIFHDTRDEMKSLGIKMHKQKDLEEYIKTVTKGKSEEEARRIRTRINGAVAFDKEQAKS